MNELLPHMPSTPHLADDTPFQPYEPLQIVDLFAGPGGLGEGFTSSGNGRRYRIVVSAEKDPAARKTLTLRAFFRLLKAKRPDLLIDYYNYCNGIATQPFSARSKMLWDEAEEEAQCITLGSQEGDIKLDKILDAQLKKNRPWVLIGGPPCQAYSVVGRARNQAKIDYTPESDNRHFLYKEYLRIIKERQPTVFVMENVKGILSSKVGGEKIFSQILKDLSDPHKALGGGKGKRYRICSLVSEQSYGPDSCFEDIDPRGYIIKSELHGIPQARHRVILLGIEINDRGEIPIFGRLRELRQKITVGDVLGGLPPLRSKLTKQSDDVEVWHCEVLGILDSLKKEFSINGDPLLAAEVGIAQKKLLSTEKNSGGLRVERGIEDGRTGKEALDNWYLDPELKCWLNHEARGHMRSDLRRYAFASIHAKRFGSSPKGHLQFNLEGLAPAHKNWESGKFSDRFRVQLENASSTTVTSHISKDGHYFIHYDTSQCRSLTVREAARLQTFPDNYFFEGNRTQQFHQVGNAVPPLLANKISAVVYEIMQHFIGAMGNQ